MAAAGALLVMTSPASAYEPTARDLQPMPSSWAIGITNFQWKAAKRTSFSRTVLEVRITALYLSIPLKEQESSAIWWRWTPAGRVLWCQLSQWTVTREPSKCGSSLCIRGISVWERLPWKSRFRAETRKSRHLDLTRSESSSLRRNAAEHPISRRVSARWNSIHSELQNSISLWWVRAIWKMIALFVFFLPLLKHLCSGRANPVFWLFFSLFMIMQV